MSLPATTMPRSLPLWWPRLDALGALASFLCAAHCVLVPMLVLAVPIAGLQVLDNHTFDRVFAVSALLFGGGVIASGYCHHRLHRVVALYLASAACLITGAFFLEASWTHGVVLALGGVFLGSAHVFNRRGVLAHGCARSVWTGADPA